MQPSAVIPRSKGERGDVLLYVAVAMVGLLAFSALVVDYGVMWASRRQAQNAADAGALSGAVSLAFVDPADQARARLAAAETAGQNRVWGHTAQVDPNSDVIVGPCPPNPPPGALPDTCVRVNVYRNQEPHGTFAADPLPTFFARLVGVTSQGVKAMATAQVLVGNASDCMKPWAIPDRWIENNPVIGGPWNWDSTWDRYDNHGALLPHPDVYVAPTSTSAGSGFRIPDDVGLEVRLKAGNPQQTLTAGWFFPVDLPRLHDNSDTGGARYRDNIASCNSVPVAIGDTIWNEPGNMIGPTKQGVDALIAQDPNARWVPGTDGSPGSITGSCTQDAPPCATKSPRLVPIPVFNVDAYSLQDKTSGRFQIQITNILGFFIEDMQGNDVMGVLVNYPGLLKPGTGTLDPSAAFLRTVALIR